MIYNLAQLMERTAGRFPEKEAFTCLNDSISYAELDRKANQLASCLIQNGLEKGDRVGIFMNRCLDTAVAVYGVLKSGGAFVAIDPFLPLNRILLIMKDCGIEQLLTTPSQSKKIKVISDAAPFLISIIGLSDEQDTKTVSWPSVFSRSLEKFVSPRILEDDLASILYTSGSTGTPKGIMHSHHNILALARLEAELHDSDEQDRIGNFAPLHFDQSLFGYFSGPLVGATTVIFPDSYVKLPASLSALVAKEKITLWFSVPLLLIQVLVHGAIEKQDFSALRWVRFGGEVFPVKQLRALMLKWPHVKFINSYGPSELFRCTYYVLDEPPKTDDPIPLGTVWGNTEYKILDANDREVERGESGELVVRTTTLMIGYWNDTERTENAFYRIAKAAGYDHIYYRTGDLVQENAKKELFFLGRKDRQIKLRGYRIELDEIEAVLLKNDAVKEAAVVIVQKDSNNRSLEAVVKLEELTEYTTDDLIRFCKNGLPPYSVPQKIAILTDFPRTATGKIDRKQIIKSLETPT
ncbi:amino acid adenylation domain-containing protein [Pricia antarctica]|uniref:Amino acid adenylation domain-containing protein n=1 Tax=Pricia antarctica TaxID=641691 RepID=A0A1G7FSL5_9FLAO|nr:amino acid adenylation domain-containing protein [Pricia antarctica]SDE78888.1 amino acid adenylation domain-containing protein [Pricia antarctica]